MSDRLACFQQHRTSARYGLGWLCAAATGVVLAASTFTCAAQPALSQEDALMLRAGSPLAGVEAEAPPQPAPGWYRVTHKTGAFEVQPVSAPVSEPGEEEAEAIDTRYIRLPGVLLAEGRLPTVQFPRGTLTPRMDHPYELSLDGAPFTLTVHNGQRNNEGLAYGFGAVYIMRAGNETYSYFVEGPGWESRVLAAADLDGDGKPDFIVQVGDQEALLLSTRTRPGLNPPSAVLALHSDGC